MDFFAMKRKQLQALCKHHGIRANLKNAEMAQRLTLLFKEDEKLISDVEVVEEKELEATEMVTDFVESPKVKKVKFSPNNETFYFVATDKDSDSDCDYSPKKKRGGRRKSKALGKKQVLGVVKSAREVKLVEVKDTSVGVMRSQKQKMVAGAVEAIVSPGHGYKEVMSGAGNVGGEGIKPVKVLKEDNAMVLRRGKVIARDDPRKRTRKENSEGASQVVPSVEAAVENEGMLPNPLLRRSKRKTTLFSSVAAAEKELGFSQADQTVRVARKPVTRKSVNAAKPGRRSSRIACKKASAETSNDMTATAVEMDRLMKENQEPSLLEESSLVVFESSAVLQVGKEVEKDVARKRPRNKTLGGNSRVETSFENEVLPPKRRSRRSNSKTASSTELSMSAEINLLLKERKIDVGLEVLEPAGNGNKTDSYFNKEAVEKLRKKRKGSRKKIESATKDQPYGVAVSTVYSDFEKSTDILDFLNENQLVESVNFQGTSMYHKEHKLVHPFINHTESAAVEDAFFSKSSMYSYSTVGVREDTDQENTVEQNPLASPDKLCNVVISSNFACLCNDRSITYGPECEGQTSNLLDSKEGSETEESIVKSISRRGGVLDDQLANGVIGSCYEDQKSIGTVVIVQVDMDSKKPAEAASGAIGEMHLDPLDSSALNLADDDAQNSSTCGVSGTNGENEPGFAEQDVGENTDVRVEIMHSENAMRAGNDNEIFENCDQYAEQSIWEGNERLKEKNIGSAILQEYVHSEKDRNEHLVVKSSNIFNQKEMYSETAKYQRANEVTEFESQDEKCASAASSDSISRSDKFAERIAYAWKMDEDSSSKDKRGGESLSFSICSDGLTHKNNAADLTGPGGMEISKENTVDGEMVEKKLIRITCDGWKGPERNNMHMLVGDNVYTDGFGMLQKVSGEKVDEGQDTGIYGFEEENHTLHSKETEETHDLHNIGTLATCSADSTKFSMLKPEMGVPHDLHNIGTLATCSADSTKFSRLKPEMGVDLPSASPVTASDLDNKALELEAASPILDNSVMNGIFRDDQTSGLKKSGPAMSKGNLNSAYIEDVKNVEECDDTFEENPIASPGQISNLVDWNEGSKTEDTMIVKSICRRGAVLDDQLASGVIAGVSKDHKLIDKIVMVRVDTDSEKPIESVAEAFGEIYLARTVPSDTTVTPFSSPVDQDVTKDNEEKYENESSYSGTSKEVVPADNEPLEELDIAQTLPLFIEEVIEGIEKSSNLSESVSPDLQNTGGQVAEDIFLNEIFGNAKEESEEKSEAFDIIQMLPTALEVHECSVLPDLPNTDGQVAEDNFSKEFIVNAPEDIKEKYESESLNGDRSPITILKRIMVELERGTMPVVLESNGDALHSSSSVVSHSNDECKQGDLNCGKGDKNSLKEKAIVDEDLAFQEDEENKEGPCKNDKLMDAMHDLSMDKNATSKEHNEELLDTQKGKDPERMNLHMPVGGNVKTDGLGMLESLSGEKVDEVLVTGICGCEEENLILNSEETEEILDVHYIGSMVTRSAYSTKPSMLKPEEGVDCPTDSPVTASNHEDEALEVEAALPISNSFRMKGLLRDDPTSGSKKSGLKMSKGNSKSEYIEDMKNAKERQYNTQDVVEELHHQEHKVTGGVVEPKSTQELSNQCHIGSAPMFTNVCSPSIWDEPGTDNTYAKPQKCSGGAIASVFNVFPSFGDLCGSKAFSKAGSENAKKKVTTNACQPAESLRGSEDQEAHTTIDNVMLIKQEADANSLLSVGYVGPTTVSPDVVESSKNNAAQFVGFEVSNLSSNEALSSKDSTLDDQSSFNLGNDVLVNGNNDNNVLADKVNTGSIEAITGIKSINDGVKSVEKNAQRLIGDSLSDERNSAYVKSFSEISCGRTESYSPFSLRNVTLSCGVFEKRHLSVEEGYDSIGLKPGRVSDLKFEDAGIDGISDTPVSGLRHDQTKINTLENIASPVGNSLGMNWLFGDEVHNPDPEMSNPTSSSGDVKKGNGGVASPQVGAGELSEHKHQAIEEVVKLKSTQESELDSIKGRALEADSKKSIGVSTTPLRKKKQRDIIPKTPKNLIDTSDMKENFPRKSEQVTNIGKPLRNRRALEDLQEK